MYTKIYNRAVLLALFILLHTVAGGGQEILAMDSFAAIDGIWNGTTSRGNHMSFEVSSLGTQWSKFRLETDFIDSTCLGISNRIVTEVPGPGPITANAFSYLGGNFSFEGTFTSESNAAGAYSYTNYPHVVPLPYPPYVCIHYLTQSGEWTAMPIVTIESSGLKDGWILESSETSEVGGAMNKGATILKVGDDADRKQYRAILSFNTSILPQNAIVQAVTLNLKKAGIVGGGNPISIFQGFMVDIKKGSFSASGLELGDFAATASKTCGPFRPKIPISDGGWYPKGWYAIDLIGAENYINKIGLTQIRLRFKVDDNNDATANFLKLYSGNAEISNRPQLIVEYYVP